MPSRRHHRKSRAGCLTCKKRHVKCDEKRPQCAKCASRGLKCEYNDTLEMPDLVSQPPADSRSPRPTNGGVRAYSAHDLELLHFYCTDANASLVRSIGLRPEEGLFALPRIVFQFDFILRAVLALAALYRDFIQHLQQNQDSEIDYVAVAAEHINDALPEYRLALHTVTEQNCSALLMFSSLLTVYVLATSRDGLNPFRQCSDESTHDADTPSMELVSWLRLIIGGTTAITPWIGYILNDADIGPRLNSELWTVERVPETADQAQRDRTLGGLEQLWVDAAGHNTTHIQFDPALEEATALSKTLTSLRKTYLWVTFRTDVEIRAGPQYCSPTDHDLPALPSTSRSLFPLFITSAPAPVASDPCSEQTTSFQTRPMELGAILMFLHTLPDDFLMLLHLRNPYALIIMAHYAVLLQQKDIWWMKGLGEDMLSWVIEGLSEQSAEPKAEHGENLRPGVRHQNHAQSDWLRWVEWPRTVFRHTGSKTKTLVS